MLSFNAATDSSRELNPHDAIPRLFTLVIVQPLYQRRETLAEKSGLLVSRNRGNVKLHFFFFSYHPPRTTQCRGGKLLGALLRCFAFSAWLSVILC